MLAGSIFIASTMSFCIELLKNISVVLLPRNYWAIIGGKKKKRRVIKKWSTPDNCNE
jgi:hypothetical protein